jgi:hypothetical protein
MYSRPEVGVQGTSSADRPHSPLIPFFEMKRVARELRSISLASLKHRELIVRIPGFSVPTTGRVPLNWRFHFHREVVFVADHILLWCMFQVKGIVHFLRYYMICELVKVVCRSRI